MSFFSAWTRAWAKLGFKLFVVFVAGLVTGIVLVSVFL
jgi:hypothetical protein